MGKPPDFQIVIEKTLKDHANLPRSISDSPENSLAVQWPWSIAKAGATHLKNHGSAVGGLVSGGSQVVSSSAGPSITKAISNDPTNPANTDRVLKDGLFGPALDGARADQLLRSVMIGWSSGAQVGVFGGDGGTGVAYDIIDFSNRSGVGYGSFNLGIGAHVRLGLIVGAMTAQPSSLNESTCVWASGVSVVAVSVFLSVIMKSSDLSLIGFGLNLGGGAGLSSSAGYGTIKTITT